MEPIMRSIDPGDLPTPDFHQYLLGSVAPRPIAFVSTINKEGLPNLTPFSFFNVFGSNPPVAIFSANRRIIDNTTKDTLHNIQEIGEVVINTISYDIVRQAAVTSVRFPSNINEFQMAHFTQLKSDLVRPYRVMESPAQMECKVRDIITLGNQGGAGHLIICDILRLHVREDVIDGNRINPDKIDLMGRMGRAYYCRASGDAIHTIIQTVEGSAIGYDALPASAQVSSILTANDIGMLSGLQEVPRQQEIARCNSDEKIQELIKCENSIEALHSYASALLKENKRELAGKVVWYAETVNNSRTP